MFGPANGFSRIKAAVQPDYTCRARLQDRTIASAMRRAACQAQRRQQHCSAVLQCKDRRFAWPQRDTTQPSMQPQQSIEIHVHHMLFVHQTYIVCYMPAVPLCKTTSNQNGRRCSCACNLPNITHHTGACPMPPTSCFANCKTTGLLCRPSVTVI